METDEITNWNFYYLSIRSYPTYEEWKQVSICILLDSVGSSYPTYEEWKLVPAYVIPYNIGVFLSYL